MSPTCRSQRLTETLLSRSSSRVEVLRDPAYGLDRQEKLATSDVGELAGSGEAEHACGPVFTPDNSPHA